MYVCMYVCIGSIIIHKAAKLKIIWEWKFKDSRVLITFNYNLTEVKLKVQCQGANTI